MSTFVGELSVYGKDANPGFDGACLDIIAGQAYFADIISEKALNQLKIWLGMLSDN
jgi:hypothetical protein